ncbi:MFS transporter [Streptomyces phaeochromogenes]|uniref:MFS transporter n=1 Tax=Streptomyces phaeochromogenes TaxID=1923 RepID=UPI0033CC9A8F
MNPGLRQERGRKAGFVALLGAVAVAAVGEAMMIVAVPWFVLETTGSVAQTGFVVAVASVGAGVTGFAAGPLVDRAGFRATAVTSYLVGGAAAAAIPLLHAAGRLDFPALLGLVLVASLFDIPGVTAVSGLVPSLARAASVPLERANALLTAVRQISQLCGPTLGGLAVALMGTAQVLLVDAAACAVAALVVALGVPVMAGRRARAESESEAGGGSGGYTAQLRDGLRTLRRHPLLRALTASSTAFNGLDSAFSGVVLVTYAYQYLGSAASLGVLLTAFGAGTAAGLFGYAAAGHRIGRRRTYLTAGCCAGLLIAPLAALPPLPVAAGLLALLGAVAAPVAPVRMTALQTSVPDGRYGRVVTAVDTLALTAVPLGSAAAVPLVAGLGLRPALLLISAAYLAVVAACAWMPAFRMMDEKPESRKLTAIDNV